MGKNLTPRIRKFHIKLTTVKLKKNKGAKRWDGNTKNANPMQIIKNKENAF